MPYKNLHILVLLREINDSRPPARVTARGAGISDRGLRRVPNPADLIALEEALRLKDSLGATVTALAVGPGRLDDTLRLAFSLGADRGIRFWDHGVEGGDAVADARCLARIVAILAPTLVFTGHRMQDRGDDPVPALAAATAGIPCITAAVSLALKQQGVEALRKSDRGGRQKVEAPFPCTVLFDEGETPRYPSIEAITRSLTAPIEEWDLADLGLPFREVGAIGARLATAEFGLPRPDPVRVVTPDPALPAFERILSLLSGGIKAREGKTHHLGAEETAAKLWEIFREEGLAQ
ncbi:electron transfer flavoprotein subunit beta/FixA family protein [Geobacter sp.]|uniref:electron transfer flavoprotein subunit beta/FixA family protein n=1 Tax=Geobacter sp. TaxID=46610 RepID=UPI00262AC8DE|nr:electron transfer flavoprotein subunit beta/FixA family protein [Geobacter sp.]